MESALLSVIIINYNTYELTVQCIESVNESMKDSGIEYEIILVDNASTECSPKLFCDKFPNVFLIENQSNLGFGIANNQGMAAAKGEFLLLLNSDTIVLKDALAKCVKRLKSRLENPLTADIAVLGCRVLNEDGSNQESYWTGDDKSIYDVVRQAMAYSPVLYRIRRYLSKTQQSSTDFNVNDQIKLVKGLYGAFVMMHRKVFESTSGFDPDFFLYSEETEWFRNRINKKFRIEFYEEPQIIHLRGQSGKNESKISKQMIASLFLYWYKRNVLWYWTYVFVAFFCAISNLLIYPLLSKYVKSQNYMVLSLFSTLFFNIPRYSSRFKGRPLFLKV